MANRTQIEGFRTCLLLSTPAAGALGHSQTLTSSQAFTDRHSETDRHKHTETLGQMQRDTHKEKHIREHTHTQTHTQHAEQRIDQARKEGGEGRNVFGRCSQK
jgi:hypothetical protein